MKGEMPVHALGELSVKVSRAYFAKDANGNTQSSMLLASMFGSAKLLDGDVNFAAAGRTVLISFKYKGDTADAREQQRYEIDIGDIIEALLPLNEKRRANNFVDAPPLQLP